MKTIPHLIANFDLWLEAAQHFLAKISAKLWRKVCGKYVVHVQNNMMFFCKIKHQGEISTWLQKKINERVCNVSS